MLCLIVTQITDFTVWLWTESVTFFKIISISIAVTKHFQLKEQFLGFFFSLEWQCFLKQFPNPQQLDDGFDSVILCFIIFSQILFFYSLFCFIVCEILFCFILFSLVLMFYILRVFSHSECGSCDFWPIREHSK